MIESRSSNEDPNSVLAFHFMALSFLWGSALIDNHRQIIIEKMLKNEMLFKNIGELKKYDGTNKQSQT